MSLAATPKSKARGKDRWNLLRDVHLVTQAGGSSKSEPTTVAPPSAKRPSASSEGLKSRCSDVAAPQEVCLPSPALSEPAPEPGLEGELTDVKGQGIQGARDLGEGEDFSDLSEDSGEEKTASVLAAVPQIQVHDDANIEGDMQRHLVLARESPKKRELQVPSSLLDGGKSARARWSERRSASRKPPGAQDQSSEQIPVESAATSTDMMSSMVKSLSGLANFKFTTNADSEDEVHNAWGENDTEDNLMERVQDLEQARGIALGPPQSAARLRRAKKNKKLLKEGTVDGSKEGASSHPDEVHPPTAKSSDTFTAASTAASSMVTTMFNSFATSVNFTVNVGKDGEDKSKSTPSNSSTKEGHGSATAAQGSLAVPMLQSHSACRERLARRRRDRLYPPPSSCESADRQSSLTSASQGTESQASLQSQAALSDTTSPGRRAWRKANMSQAITEDALSSVQRSSLYEVAASSFAEFQKLFQSDEGETYYIWGADDTPEKYQERLKALDRACREPASGTMLHHRLMRRRQKKQELLERKNQDLAEATEDPFLLT